MFQSESKEIQQLKWLDVVYTLEGKEDNLVSGIWLRLIDWLNEQGAPGWLTDWMSSGHQAVYITDLIDVNSYQKKQWIEGPLTQGCCKDW